MNGGYYRCIKGASMSLHMLEIMRAAKFTARAVDSAECVFQHSKSLIRGSVAM